ncbi:hypothetical protein HWV00_20860 (plasmid) [Moritella sp. 24]|uniref:hypothetical protein n=1 Tax=Moritella sp. 24 TaxID=2746230 RepID=UPI001BA62729|nr:hypothetical protein [Moritella sp. 24]QUM78725.1 hypothetical protein HWV00_20860 [Moritella sp. 24]
MTIENKIENIIIYNKKSEVPAHLVGHAAFNGWQKKLIQPCAKLVTKKQTRSFYDHDAELVRLKNEYPLRFNEDPNLYDRTELKRLGFADSEIQNPQAERVTSYGNWYYLYAMPKAMY